MLFSTVKYSVTETLVAATVVIKWITYSSVFLLWGGLGDLWRLVEGGVSEVLRHTHGAEVARAAELPLKPTEQQHLLQLVPEPVQELPHGRLGLPRRRQEVIEVQNPRERGPRRVRAFAVAPQRDERVSRGGRDLPVLPENSQPPARAEDVRFLHAPRQQQVLVADGDGGENEPLRVHHVRLGVHGRGEQVPHSVGGPGEEESQGC